MSSVLQLLKGINGGTSTSAEPQFIKRLCSNALDRMCEKVLDIDFVQSIVDRSTTKAVTGQGNIKNGDNRGLALLPIVYDTFFDYVRAWEPLLILEMREAMISNFLSNVAGRCVQDGIVQFTIPEVLSTNVTSIDILFRPSGKGNSNFGNGDNDVDCEASTTV